MLAANELATGYASKILRDDDPLTSLRGQTQGGGGFFQTVTRSDEDAHDPGGLCQVENTAMKQKQMPESVEEALHRAAHHARNAIAELVAATRSLLHAVSLVASSDATRPSPTLASLARLLDELEAHIAAPTRDSSAAEPLLIALSEALDVEIARWEKRAERDSDARAVLRAFLGLRELLWELGVRPAAPDNTEASADPIRRNPQNSRNSRVTAAQAGGTRSGSGPRVQRVRVKG